MVAIYPDDGSGGLKPMSRSQGLKAVRWEHDGTDMAMAIYPDDTDGTLRPLSGNHGASLFPVHWFHEGRYPLTANFNDEYPVSGGGEEYTTGAVHFNGTDASLVNDSLAAADSSLLSLSFWMLVPTTSDDGTHMLYVVDPTGAYNPGLQRTGSTLTPLSFLNGTTLGAADADPNDVGWHHYLISVDLGHPLGEKSIRLYIDDIDKTSLFDEGEAEILLFNGLAFLVGDDTGGSWFDGDLADFWFAPGVSLLTGSDITEATRRKFISAESKPVDLGADGATPTGTAPAIFFRRDPAAAASTFANNLGTGGPFTITGTLTNALTSPSD